MTTPKAFSFRGASHPDPLTRGSAPGPRWGHSPQTPIIGSRSALAIWPPPNCTPGSAQELSQARSKPDPADRVWTAHYIGVHMMCTIRLKLQKWIPIRTNFHWTAIQVLWCTTAQSWSNNLPSYPPDNHHSSDVVCWMRGGCNQRSSPRERWHSRWKLSQELMWKIMFSCRLRTCKNGQS